MTDTKMQFPPVGSSIRKFYREKNANNWKHFGEVRAIVDDEVMVIRRWLPHRRYHVYQVICAVEWGISCLNFDVKDPSGKLIARSMHREKTDA